MARELDDSIIDGDEIPPFPNREMDTKDSGKAPPSSNGRLVYVRRNHQPKEPAAPSPQVPISWEERYHQLQVLLNKLDDESDQSHHVEMLWSLSSAELSNHAVELEKRSIQFSLEEAREMQRVAALNVLGKSLKSTSE